MGYIPKDSKWYIADIVVEITVENDRRNVIQKNKILIGADSPAEAYEKAMELGKEQETSYKNPDNDKVSIIFRGLKDLNIICDELKHGAELYYEEDIAVPEEKIQSLIASKGELAIFAPRCGPDGKPNYMPACVAETLIDLGVSPEELK